jgi:hypothetical protein
MVCDQVPTLFNNLLRSSRTDVQSFRDTVLRVAHLNYIRSEKNDDVCAKHAVRSKIAKVSCNLASRLTLGPSDDPRSVAIVSHEVGRSA